VLGPMGATDWPTEVETFTCSTVDVPSILLMYSAVKLSMTPKHYGGPGL
jgi:hypothetical protein